MNNWIEISPANLVGNFRALQGAVGDATEALAVVKANAYGHGAEQCAVTLAQAGAGWLGVTCAAEGIRVRQALAQASPQSRPQILVMCGFEAHEVPLLCEHDLTPVVWTLQQVEWLASAPIPVHVETDTGMNRQGVRPGPELAELLTALKASRLSLDGILTHFASSEEFGSPLTRAQQRHFESAVAQVRQLALHPAWVHAGASSAIDNPAQESPWLASLAASIGARPMVRVGIALYGYTLPIAPANPDSPAAKLRPMLKPVMTWKARILSVRTLEPGETIGYNATFTAPSPMRIALLPVGFADGLRRELSSTTCRSGGWVMLHGRRAPILGRISMNLTVVDITAIPAAAPGDVAVVLGEGISADDHARLARTTAYEILCGIHPCN